MAATQIESSHGSNSRNYPADTAKQRFMEEIYNKETSIRLGWYFAGKNSRASGSADHLGTASRQKEVSRKRIEDACPRPTSSLLRLRDRFVAPADYRKRAFRLDGLPVASSASPDVTSPSNSRSLTTLVPDMIEADSATKSRLYTGLSHDGKGRVDYLKARAGTLPPEERYRLPMTSSFEYGWRLNDVMDEPVKPTHGRAKLVRETFYARNGVNTLPLPLAN